jgi:hypothetical protein
LSSSSGPTFFLLFTLWCSQLCANALLFICAVTFFFSSHYYYSPLLFAMLPLLFTLLLSPFQVVILMFALLLFSPFRIVALLSSLHCCSLIYIVVTLLFSYSCSSTSFFTIVFLRSLVALVLLFVEGSCPTTLHSFL